MSRVVAPGEDALLPTARRTRPRRQPPPLTPAPTDPVASVILDLPQAHLDRPFDYLVPSTYAETARPGARVKVRFAGREVAGFILERGDGDGSRQLQALRRVVSPEPVLTPEVFDLCTRLAERYAGTRADLLRLAIPARHAAAEKQPRVDPAPSITASADPGPWVDYTSGEAFVKRLAAGDSPRAVWGAAPGADWPRMLALLAAATAGGATGRGVVICVPSERDVARVDASLTSTLGPDRHVVLTADVGPGRRYGRFLDVLRGRRRVVVGSRAAAFAPVADLGLVVVWDDGDDTYAEPRAPYPHTREVLLTRAEHGGAAVLVGAHSRSVEAHRLVGTGWAQPILPPRALVRRGASITISGGVDREALRDPAAGRARIPHSAHEAIRSGLRDGPVLVQTARRGYAPTLSCSDCRTPARCRQCGGPLAISGADRAAHCSWCGREEPAWHCPGCGHSGLRVPVPGTDRTATEFGRMFAGFPVRVSDADHALSHVPSEPALVVATAGAEPVAHGGYRTVVLLDTAAMLSRVGLRTEEECLRRWLNAAALVAAGGQVIAVGQSAEPALQALLRWDPAGFADRETEERRSAGWPPATRLATITGPEGAVADAVTLLAAPAGTEVLGPVGEPDRTRVVLRVPRSRGPLLTTALGEVQRLRSARKLDPVRIHVDPDEL